MTNLRRSRAKKRVVLDVGSSAIRLCELTQTKAGYQLTKYYRREVLIDPLLDEEAKKKLRVDGLKSLLKEAKIGTRRTIFAVPGRSVFTRTRTLPPVPEHKLTQIVRYEIQQQIPFALDQIALDYQILSKTESGGYDVMMAAIKVDVVDKHIDALREARRSIDAVDVCPIAAYNWLKHIGEFGNKGECVALLDLGASTTDIVIERGSQFRFTRPLNLAGNDITSAIRDAFGMNFAEAEKLKRERGFAPTGDPQRDGKLGEVIGGVLSRLVTEITRSFAYFRSQPGGGSIDRILVTGGGVCLRGIVPYLQRQFGVEVKIAQPTAGLAIAPAAQEVNEHPEQTGVVLGMALRGLQQVSIEINLIPPQILAAARRREQLRYWVLTFITLGFIAASVIPARETKDRQIRDQIDTLRQYVRQYDQEVAEDPSRRSVYIDQLAEQKREVEFRQRQLGKLEEAYKNCLFWLDDLKLLNILRPEGGKIWLSSVETSVISPGNTQQGPGGKSAPKGGLGFASRTGARSGVPSTGFGSIYSDVRGGDSSRGGMRGIGGESSGGLGGLSGALRGGPPGRGGPGATPQSAQVPVPNGYRIFGYAKDPDSLMLFIKQLKECPRFKEGVYYNEADFEQVYMTELEYARVPQSGGGQSSGASAPVSSSGQWETAIFFQVDVQFAPSPTTGVPGKAGVGGAPEAPGETKSPGSKRMRRGRD